MPDDLKGKILITNTTTAKNVEELRERGVHLLVTTTPRLGGRSFGTNVMEAALLALIDKSQSKITQTDFLELIERIPLEPNIEVLQ
jgi:ATP-dependent 26S proteasome regulatory subunit